MPTRTIRTAVILFAAGLAASPALAQQYRGEGGTLLDRNLQVGSGGKNSRARDIRDQIWFNNQIITGNAPAGRSFRGYVGYTAVNQFRGVAGSDANYSFQRDSTSGAQVATGVRASDALRYQMNLTTGQSAPAYLANTYITRRDSDAASAATATSTSAALRSTADYLTSRSLRPTLVRTGADPDGREWTLTASPLVGFSRVYTDTPAAPSASDLLNTRPVEPVTPGAPGSPPTGEGQSVTPGAPMPAPSSSAWPTNRPSGLESRGVNFRSSWQEAHAGEPRPAGNALSRSLDTAVDSTAMNTRSAAHNRALDVVRRAYGDEPTAETASGAAAGADAASDQPKSYADRELERIRRVLRGLPPTPPVAKAKPGTTTDGEPGTDPAAPAPAGDPSKPLNTPVAGTEATDRTEATKPISPEILRALRSLGETSLDSLLPSVSAQSEPALYQAHMAAAERALRDGRFFESEDRFTRAIAAMPADALAKAGRVNAQLGAGLFLSASSNLRQLLASNPEVVGLRFDPKLAPDAERTREIATQLRKEVDQGSTGMGLEASLLLSYLGRVSGDQAMVDEGLAAMSSRLPADDPKQATLHELLKGVWGSGK